MSSSSERRHPSRPLRVLPRGPCLVEITTRTVQGRPLLKPTKQANEAIKGVLGRALFLSPKIGLVAIWCLSNHYTMLIVTPNQRELSRFLRHLNGNIGKEVGRQFGWRGPRWERRYRGIFVARSEPTQVGRLKYLLAQGTKEGLVARPAQWLGVNSLRVLTHGAKMFGVWFDRTKEHNANRRHAKDPKWKRKVFPTTYPINHVPLPAWDDLTPAQYRDECRKLVREIEREAKRARKGKPPLGMAKIMAANPRRAPKSVKVSDAPICHGSGQEQREFCDFYDEVVVAFRAASVKFRSGDMSALHEFPRGAFAPSMFERIDASS